MPDGRMNLAVTTVAAAPSPATTGLTISVASGEGARFPAAPFTIGVCPSGTAPTLANCEFVRITSRGTGDNWTIPTGGRNYESTYSSGMAARNIVAGDQVFLANPTAGMIDQIAGLPDYAKGLGLINLFAILQGVYNYKSSNTRHADQGLTNASRGIGGTNQAGYDREVAIGDSVTAGCTSGVGTITYARGDAWPLAMRDTLSIWGIPANGTGLERAADVTTAPASTYPNYVSSGFASATTYALATVNGSTLVWTVTRPGTIVDVFFADGFSGTFSISVNGAASGAGFASVTAAGVLRTGKKRLVVNVWPGSTVKITVTTAGNGVGIIGLNAWTPNGGLIMDNIAQGGSRAGGATGVAIWTDTTTSTAPWQVFGGTYKGGISGKQIQRTDVNLTSGSATITLSGAAFFDADQHTGVPLDCVPDATVGIEFPPGTYISSVTDSTHAVASQLAIATKTGATVNFDRDPGAVHVALGGNDLQNARTGAQIKADLVTLYNLIKTTWPNCDVMFILENELAPANASAAQELDMQQNILQLGDLQDSTIYDWRDRAGNFATAMANGIMQDPVAHMTAAMYVNLGCAYAFARCIAGSGPQQAVRGPTLDNDVAPKWYVDGLSRYGNGPLTADGTAWTATEQVAYKIFVPPNSLKVGDSFTLKSISHYTATAVGAILSRLRVGTAGTTSDTSVVATAATANMSATALPATGEVDVTVRAVGASGSIVVCVRAKPDNSFAKDAAVTTATVDTTGPLWFDLCMTASGGTIPSGTPKIGYVQTWKKN